MSKEKILEEFDKEFGKDGFYVETSIDCNNNYTNTEIKQFLSKAIDQTREETIREVEIILDSLIREECQEESLDNTSSEWVKVGYNKALYEIKQSLKSLINKPTTKSDNK